MAHIVIEYSANLRGQVDLPAFLRTVHEAALATGFFPIGGIRTRAYEAQHHVIADAHPDNAFVHISLRVGHGRDVDIRKRACEAIFAAAVKELEGVYERLPLGIALEMQLFEINQAVFFDTNPIPMKYMMKRLGILPANEHRLPMVPATAELERKLDAVLKRVGLLEDRAA